MFFLFRWFKIHNIVFTGMKKVTDLACQQEYVNVQVMDEADVDEDDKLSYAEFQNIVSRAPNFVGYAGLLQLSLAVLASS